MEMVARNELILGVCSFLISVILLYLVIRVSREVRHYSDQTIIQEQLSECVGLRQLRRMITVEPVCGETRRQVLHLPLQRKMDAAIVPRLDIDPRNAAESPWREMHARTSSAFRLRHKLARRGFGQRPIGLMIEDFYGSYRIDR